MSLSVAGKYAIITGAGSGINLAFAKLLLQRGCSVLIGDLALRPEAEELLNQHPHTLRDQSRPVALFHKTNVTSWPQLSSLFRKAVDTFPQVDIVVPGAGIFEPEWSSFWHPPNTAEHPKSPSRDDPSGEPGTYATININLTHPIRLSQLAIDHWTRTKSPGCLVHVSSVAGHAHGLNSPLYFATKHGIHAFVRSLGGLRNQLGIRVSAVAPGSVKTPMWLEDPDKLRMTRGDGIDPFVEVDRIAQGMLQLCENKSYGDGTILEVIKNTERVVPFYHAPPPAGPGTVMPGYTEAQAQLFEQLKTKGMTD